MFGIRFVDVLCIWFACCVCVVMYVVSMLFVQVQTKVVVPRAASQAASCRTKWAATSELARRGSLSRTHVHVITFDIHVVAFKCISCIVQLMYIIVDLHAIRCVWLFMYVYSVAGASAVVRRRRGAARRRALLRYAQSPY